MDKASLLSPHIPEADVDLPGGGTVRIRALSATEAHRLKALGEDTNLIESSLLAAAMVDPDLDEAEVDQWRANAPVDEIQAVVNTILELSGLTKDAQKDAESSFRS